MGNYIACFVTIDDQDKATEIARALVSRRLVACVNIIAPVRSLYLWKGEVCDDQELLLMMKTRAELFPDLERAVKELHPYEVPEIIGFGIDHGLEEYLDWINECTS